MTVQLSINGIAELDFPTAVPSVSISQEKATVNINNQLAQDDDVLITTPADGQVLTYNAASGKWKNAAASGGTASVTASFNLIAEQQPTGNSVTFNSIPATYRDLLVVVRGRGDAVATFKEVRLQLNGDTGNNYSHEDIIMNNATNSSSGGDLVAQHFMGWVPAANAPTSNAGTCEARITDYADTTLHKSILSQGGVRTAAGAANLFAVSSAGWWFNTAAVNSVKVFLDSGNFVTGSIVSLYGIGGSTPTNIATGVAGIVVGNGASVPATGSKGFLQIPYNGTIQSWTMLADQSGSAQITVKKSTYAGFPTTTSIVASLPPSLTSQQKNTSSTLTGWTTAITAGDVLEFNLDSITTCQRVTLELTIQKS